MTEGWFHTQGLTNNGIYSKARRRDEGIPPYRDKIPLACIRKSRAFDSSAFAFYGDFLFYALLLFFFTHSPHTTVMNMVMSISGRVLPSTKSMFIKMR